jgi:hypothetical protein
MEPRQQLVEQTLVELQTKVKTYEERQERLLNNINQAISELLEKAAKQRGVRGQDTLALHHFFATHLASAIQQLELIVDEKLRSAPQIPASTAMVPYTSTPELETRLALLESKAVQPSTAIDLPQIQELESKLQQLEENTVKELRRIHQTTFKPGEYGTPLNQLQQKVSNLESQVRSITTVDAVKLAETTMSTAIRSFRTEFEETLKKYVSAEDLFAFKAEISRLDELVIEAQTRSHTLLQKSSHIESYVANMLGQYKAAAMRMEESIMLEYQKFDRNLESHYRQWCQKQFAIEAVSIRAQVLDESKQYFVDITDKVAKEQGHIFDQNTKRMEQVISQDYTNAKRTFMELVQQLDILDTDTRARIAQQYKLTEDHIQNSRAVFSELTLSVQKTVQTLYERYSIQESNRLDGILSQCIQKIVVEWDSIQDSIQKRINEKITALELLRKQSEQYVINSEEIIKRHIQKFEKFVVEQEAFTTSLQEKSEILISSTAEFVEYQKQNLQSSYEKYAQDLTNTVDKKLKEVQTWDQRISQLTRKHYDDIEQQKATLRTHIKDFENQMKFTLDEKVMAIQSLDKMALENQSKFNEYIAEEQEKNKNYMRQLESYFLDRFLQALGQVEQAESAATKRIQELQQYTPKLELLISEKLQDIQSQAQTLVDEHYRLFDTELSTFRQKMTENVRQTQEKSELVHQEKFKQYSQMIKTYAGEFRKQLDEIHRDAQEAATKFSTDTFQYKNDMVRKNDEIVQLIDERLRMTEQNIRTMLSQSKQETIASLTEFDQNFKLSTTDLKEKQNEIATVANRLELVDQLARQFSGITGKLTTLDSISFKVESFLQKTGSDASISEQRIEKLEKLIEKQQDMILDLMQKSSVRNTSLFSSRQTVIERTPATPPQPVAQPPPQSAPLQPKQESAPIQQFKAGMLKTPQFNVPQLTPPTFSSPLQSLFQPKSKGTPYTALTKCFYTAIFGTPGQPVDRLPSFVPIPGWDAICFTNQDVPNTIGWTVEKVEMPFPNASLSSKYYKWMSHLMLEDYDVVVWMDAYLAPDRTKTDLLESWLTAMYMERKTIGHRPHGERNCIYDECDAVVKGKRDTPANVDKVRKLLTKVNMPKNKGLFDSNLMIKFHKDATVQGLCRDIFNQLQNYSNRDQLAITYQYYVNKFTQVAVFPLMEAWQKRGEHVRIPAF